MNTETAAPTYPAAEHVTVFYHADCLDGFGAAYAAWRRFGDAARFRSMHYGDGWALDDVAGRHVFVLDFSFRRNELATIAEHAASVRELDHHASAREEWADVLRRNPASGREAYSDAVRNLTVEFDLDKSGARIAWDWFQPDTPVPLPIAHIEDIDLWRFRIDGTRPFCRALRMRPFAFDAWQDIVEAAATASSARYQALLAEGEAIERFCRIEVDRLADGGLVVPVTLAQADGKPAIEGLAVNASAVFTSDLGGRLAERSGTFGLVWQYGDGGRIKASLRGCGNVDLGALAGRYGGGGHFNAAGFVMPAQQFFASVLTDSVKQ